MEDSAGEVKSDLEAAVEPADTQAAIVGPFADEAKPIQDQALVSKRFFATAILPLAFSFAFVSMALEVVWSRLLCLLLGSSTYAVGGVLALNMIGLALGGGGAYLSPKRPLRLVAAASISTAIYLAATLILLPRAVWMFLYLEKCALSAHRDLFFTFLFCRLVVAAFVILPSAVNLGIVFPCLIARGIGKQGAVWSMGKLLALSTVGSICGALAAGLLIPNSTWVSGMEFCFVALTCLLTGLAMAADGLSPVPAAAENNFVLRFRFLALCALPIVFLMFRPPGIPG